jgi:formylglycine-generating enzyme required for sulfatase activity
MAMSRPLVLLTSLVVLVGGFGLRAEALPSRTNSIQMTMVKLPSGSFTMGSPLGEPGRGDDEVQHRVALSRSFYISAHEVTQLQYKAVTGENPSEFSSCGASCPVEMVTWFDALIFANQLSEREGLSLCYAISRSEIRWHRSCTGYRLPTEAEWEYAARGGEASVYSGSNTVDDVGWVKGNSEKRTYPVGQKKPNAWGLYDMTGNVWEWTWDIYGPYSGKAADPAGASSDPDRGKSWFDLANRVYRGGGWFNKTELGRVANRSYNKPRLRFPALGFRLVRTAQ